MKKSLPGFPPAPEQHGSKPHYHSLLLVTSVSRISALSRKDTIVAELGCQFLSPVSTRLGLFAIIPPTQTIPSQLNFHLFSQISDCLESPPKLEKEEVSPQQLCLCSSFVWKGGFCVCEGSPSREEDLGLNSPTLKPIDLKGYLVP